MAYTLYCIVLHWPALLVGTYSRTSGWQYQWISPSKWSLTIIFSVYLSSIEDLRRMSNSNDKICSSLRVRNIGVFHSSYLIGVALMCSVGSLMISGLRGVLALVQLSLPLWRMNMKRRRRRRSWQWWCTVVVGPLSELHGPPTNVLNLDNVFFVDASMPFWKRKMSMQWFFRQPIGGHQYWSFDFGYLWISLVFLRSCGCNSPGPNTVWILMCLTIKRPSWDTTERKTDWQTDRQTDL